MPYEVVRFQETPNPNALKCLLDRRIAERPRSYSSAEQARGDALAEALFAIDGVTNLLVNTDWITVNKRPDAPWAPIKRAVQRVLHGAA